MKRRNFLTVAGLPLALGPGAWGPGPLLAAPPALRIRDFVVHKHSLSGRDYLFLEVRTEEGLTGLGEGSLPSRIDIVEQAIRWLEPYFRGRNPAGVDEHWNRAYYELSRWRDGSVLMTALAAVDIALWDLEAKALGVPVWRLCGAAAAKPLAVYYSHWGQGLSPRSPAALTELAAQSKASGWRAVKWVVPRAASESERIAQAVADCRAVRSAGLDFALEMFETFSVRSALAFARAVEPFEPLFLEEPVLRESPQALSEVAAGTRIPIAAGEGLLTRYDFRQLLDRPGVRIVQPDVIHCGGITEFRRIAALAEAYAAEISPHMWYGPVAHAASIHAMMATRNFYLQEWDAVHDSVFAELTRGTALAPVKGTVTASARPGLGIEMDWELWNRRCAYQGPSQRVPGGR